jgi:hypothetical protein
MDAYKSLCLIGIKLRLDPALRQLPTQVTQLMFLHASNFARSSPGRGKSGRILIMQRLNVGVDLMKEPIASRGMLPFTISDL